MIGGLVVLFDALKSYRGQEIITTADIFKACADSRELPKSKSDIYFLLTTATGYGIIEKVKQGVYKVDWKRFNSLRDKWDK